MRTETTTRNLYTFEELSSDAQQKAIENLWDINVVYEWWDGVYEDANRIGMEITEFDLDRASYVKAKIDDCLETATLIIQEHGQNCDTYKLAETFITERDKLVDEAERDEEGNVDEYELDNKLDELENEFKKDLCEEYRIILQKEYEYLTSEESIIDTIESNEYEFTEDGELA